jgi:hypothetical protein
MGTGALGVPQPHRLGGTHAAAIAAPAITIAKAVIAAPAIAIAINYPQHQ